MQGNINNRQSPLVVILGPTAAGKSALGIALAQKFEGEIVSADSRQVYRGMDIGTAKITPAERTLVRHHLLDVANPQDTYTVSQFQHAAIEAIDDILARSRQPFLVGGSPHYIQSVVDNLDIPQVPPQSELRAELEARPLTDLIAQLEKLDPQSAAKIDRNNPRRILRALEVCLVTGKPFSDQRGINQSLYDMLLLGIHWPRDILYRRIDMRIDERMGQGLIQEVENLLADGLPHERLEAMGLEYRFVSRWLRGMSDDNAEMVQRLKYATHDFVRRQLSWFRKDQRIIWIEGGDDMVQETETKVSIFLSKFS